MLEFIGGDKGVGHTMLAPRLPQTSQSRIQSGVFVPLGGVLCVRREGPGEGAADMVGALLETSRSVARDLVFQECDHYEDQRKIKM